MLRKSATDLAKGSQLPTPFAFPGLSERQGVEPFAPKCTISVGASRPGNRRSWTRRNNFSAWVKLCGELECMSSDKRKRQRVVSVRLTEDEFERIRAHANVTNSSSVPAFLRAVGLKQRLKSSSAPVADRDELRRIKIQQGFLANELAKLADEPSRIPDADQLAAHTSKTLEEVMEMNALIRKALGYDH